MRTPRNWRFFIKKIWIIEKVVISLQQEKKILIVNKL
jgi:hypothetical protein